MRPLQVAPSHRGPQVGPRLRASRLSQGLTIEQVAKLTGLTKGFLSRVERDETSPSVATLLSLCQALSLPIGNLFSEPDTQLVSLEDAPLINMGGTSAVERLVTPRGQARVQMMISEIAPGGSGGEDLYTINCDVEVLHVISGHLEVRFSDRTLDARSGDTLTFPGSEPHTWRCVSQEPTRVAWVMIPAAWSGSS